MITWVEKVAFVGMTVEIVPSVPSEVTCYRYCVRLRIPDGLCSYGDGHTIEEAIESAAYGMNMDWWSVETKMTEHEWQQISHE